MAVLFVAVAGIAIAQTPDAPLIGPAFAGVAQVFVSFSAPASGGDSPISSYGAVCIPNVGGGTVGTSGVTAPIVVSGLVNGTAYNCAVTATNASGPSAPSAGVSVTPILNAPLTLIGIQSRKTHGPAGVFDVAITTPMAIDGAVNVEPRASGTGHRIVFQFNTTVNSLGPVTALDESSAFVTATATPAGNEVVVLLAATADNKRINVSLPTVNGTAVNASASVGLLMGDANNTRSVNAIDLGTLKARSGQLTTAANFRFDLNASGIITAADIAAVKAHGGVLTGIRSPVVARVEIAQTGLILTQAGAVKQLSAKAFDAQGNLLNVPVSWTSSQPAVIGVDGNGLATAAASGGSSQILALAGGIASAPLLAVVTQPALGAILLTDAQIVGEPFDTTPDASPSFTNTYQVRLSGIAPPAIGAILINTESKVVGGRVVAVDSMSNPIIVTLALVSLRELFPTLVLTETLDLANAPILVPTDIAAAYTFTRTGNTFTFTPKASGAQASAANAANAVKANAVQSLAMKAGVSVAPTLGSPQGGATGTRALPPFTSCETSITGGGGVGAPLPIALSAPPLFSITASPKLDIKLDLFTITGVERFVVDAEPIVKFEGGINIAVAFEGKIECKAELFAYVIPVGGPLALILGGVVPMGVGFEAGGKLTVATMGIGTKVEVKGKVKAGIVCVGGNLPCTFDRALENLAAKMTPTLDTPSIGDIRLEPSLSAFGYMEAAIGNVFLKKLRFDFVKIKAGAKLAGSFALKASQLADTTYASDYKLSLEASAGAGANIDGVLALLGLTSVNALELVISTEIAKSPAGLAGDAVTADKSIFVTGDTVNFTVKLDPPTVDFFPGLGPYNVKKIQLVRNVGGTIALVGSVDAIPGDTTFGFVFTAPDSGTVGQFSAFVVTWLLPLDLLALEVGSGRRIDVTPKATTLAPLGSLQFVATIIGQADQRVTWTASRGAITDTGRFTAPSTFGPVTITATSVADPALVGTTTTTVADIPTTFSGGLTLSYHSGPPGVGIDLDTVMSLVVTLKVNRSDTPYQIELISTTGAGSETYTYASSKEFNCGSGIKATGRPPEIRSGTVTSGSSSSFRDGDPLAFVAINASVSGTQTTNACAPAGVWVASTTTNTSMNLSGAGFLGTPIVANGITIALDFNQDSINPFGGARTVTTGRLQRQE